MQYDEHEKRYFSFYGKSKTNMSGHTFLGIKKNNPGEIENKDGPSRLVVFKPSKTT